MKTLGRLNVTIPLRLTLVIGLATCASAAVAQERGTCITAKVPEAYTLLDGTMHPAGRITICSQLMLNPVTGLHRIWAEGEGAAFAMSRRFQPREFSDGRATLLFRRDPGGTLDLVGYVVPFNHRAWSYILRHTGGHRMAEPTALDAARPEGELVTLLASPSSRVR